MNRIFNRPKQTIKIEKAIDSFIYTDNNQRLVDFTSGWNVTNVGWNNPKLFTGFEVLKDSTYYTPAWCENDIVDKFFEEFTLLFSESYSVVKVTSGSEAVEAAIKIARRIVGRKLIMGFQKTYHGWTEAAYQSGGLVRLHNLDGVDNNNYHHLPFPDYLRESPEQIHTKILEEVKLRRPAAIILESIFTNPGGQSLNKEFANELFRHCKQNDILIIFDEVGTGFGRTGKMFGFEHFEVIPDILCFSKAITGGMYPMGCTLVLSKYISQISNTGFSSTYGGTPFGCFFAMNMINIIKEENLILKTESLGRKLLEAVNKDLRLENGFSVRGTGLFVAIEIFNPKTLNAANNNEIKLIKKMLLNEGIYIESSDFCNALLLMPPLIIDESLLIENTGIIVNVLKDFKYEKSI